MMNLVSVILPVFNGERYLREALAGYSRPLVVGNNHNVQ
jgi:hypothetical protein